MSFTTRRDFYDVVTVDGIKELDYLTSRLNVMELDTVEYHIVDTVTEYRPDLISLRYFGNYDLGWLIAEHNGFLDTVNEFYCPRVVRIPSLTQYNQYYNRNTRKV